MKRVRSILFLSFLSWSLTAASSLDEYVALGLKSNLALKEREFSLQKSLEVLKQAKGMFFPSLSLDARYSRAGGGRVIDFPVGDLLNPIYKNLNDLFRFHGINAGFPTDIPNQGFPFYRAQEQDTKLRLIQPVFQPAILHNYRIQSSLAKMSAVELLAFKRQLVMDIKGAYYTYLKTLEVMEVLNQTRLLLQENLRVSDSLFKNGKATEDVVFRARAELSGLQQKLAEAEKNRVQAASYFNFLVNRPLTEPIVAVQPEPQNGEPRDLVAAQKNALEHRDELEQMVYALKAVSHQQGLADSRGLPSLTAVFDYGFQGETYRLTGDDDYWMLSLVLSWTLFDGGQTRAQRAQARLERRKLEVQEMALSRQVELQVQGEFYALEAARLGLEAAIEREQSAKSSFEIVAKKYQYGMAPQVEYLDAQTAFTGAAVNRAISRFDYLIQEARFEWAAALDDVNRYLDGEK